MDAMTGANAAHKTIDMLKSMPAWLLVGLSISLGSIWLWPPFFTSLPEPVRSALPVVLFVAAILTICNIGTSVFTYLREQRQLSRARDHQRLLKLYRPLDSLFLTRHVTICTGTASPYLRDRLENAWTELRTHRRRNRVKRAWRTLFDRRVSSSAEIEYGGDFPLSKIVAMVRESAGDADTELLDLISRADRSRYEEFDCAILTDAEFALFDHIDKQHRRLSARVR